VGFAKKTVCGFLCPSSSLYYGSLTQRISIRLKGYDEAGAQKVVDAFYKAISPK
jgi:hypothetical protein